MELDRTDQKIVEVLQKNGRIRNLELADAVNLSNTPCAKRVKRLEESGIISGYRAVIDPKAAGFHVCAFVLLQISSNTREAADRFAEKIKEIPAITECHMTTGTMDYIARIYARSLSDYESIIKDDLGKIDDIVKAESLIVLNDLVPSRGLTL